MDRPARIVAVVVLIALLLGVAVLEMVSERVRVEPAFPEPAPDYVAELELRENPDVPVTSESKEVARERRAILALQGSSPEDLDLER